MRKIISLFKRDYEGTRLVFNEVVPGAEWVIAGEGTATRKWDGTCCMVRDGKLYKRYDAKKGKTPPTNFEPAQDYDEVTGHMPGWVPVGDGPDDQWHREAVRLFPGVLLLDGTYELCGPKVQGNPEGLCRLNLVRHGWSPGDFTDPPRDFDGIKAYLAANDIEGIVWWRDINDPNCDKVKIKAKDFGLKRQSKQPKHAEAMA